MAVYHTFLILHVGNHRIKQTVPRTVASSGTTGPAPGRIILFSTPDSPVRSSMSRAK
jgi:hypothetical protein